MCADIYRKKKAETAKKNHQMAKETTGDNVLILERMTTNLDVTNKTPNDYVLEGPAAELGIENNNHRIYEEAEYLPHLEYLNQKIKQRRLLGELDHPKEFDTSLKNVSHIIEGLVYDKESKQVRIKVRLLNNMPHGEMAKALVDAGVPLSISSRAAGTVKENKRVQIRKIFTYDLVADPGFEKAQLLRINESVSNSLDDLRKDSIVNSLQDITDSLITENSDSIRIYKVNENDQEFMKLLEDNEKTNTTDMSKYVTVEELNEYSAIIKKEMTAIKTAIKEKLSQTGTPINEDTMKAVEERLSKVENYSRYLAENLDKGISYTEYLAENLDKNIEYSKYIAENLDKNISYAEYLAENLDGNIAYSEYLAENLDRGISFADYLAENLEKGIAYTEYLAENLDKNISYAEYLAENLDGNISYSEYIAENLDKNISYAEYLAENLDRGISYAEYLAEKLEKNIEYSEYIAENVNTGTGIEGAVNVSENTDKKEIVEVAAVDYANISSKIDGLLETVKKQKTASTLNESKYHFFRFLSAEKRDEFTKLDETHKEKVVGALKTGAYFSEANIMKIWEQALVEKTEEIVPNYILHIPAKYKPIYEALSQEEKDSIEAQAKLRNMETPYQITNFWQTRNLGAKPVGLIKLNENESETKVPVAATIGYKNDYVASVADEIGKRFKK